LSEDSILHRYEASGGLTGLERVRTMDLADIHIFARPDQIKSEIKRTYEMLKEIHSVLGIEFSSVDLSLHDPNDKAKFYDNPEM
ncbi:threonine--tRNA ligase, partial [bacterium]|nr:threonine--tRNA ligase [bacterium]